MEKRCSKCKEIKPVSEFGRDRRNKDGLNCYCKICKKAQNDHQRDYRIEYYRQYYRLEREAFSAWKEERGMVDHPSTTRPKGDSVIVKQRKLKYDKEYSREYRKDHPDYCRKTCHNYRAKKLAKSGELTKDEIVSCLTFFGGNCAYSGVPIGSTYHLDHIIPLSQGGQNTIYNIVPCLPTVNLIKSTKDFETWYPTQSFYSEQRYLKIKEWMKKGEV